MKTRQIPLPAAHAPDSIFPDADSLAARTISTNGSSAPRRSGAPSRRSGYCRRRSRRSVMTLSAGLSRVLRRHYMRTLRRHGLC